MYKLLIIFTLSACGVAPRVLQVHEKHLYVRQTNDDLGVLVNGTKAYSLRFNAVIDFARPIELYVQNASFDCRLSASVIVLSEDRMNENMFIAPNGLLIKPESNDRWFAVSGVYSYDWNAQRTQCDSIEPAVIRSFGYSIVMEKSDMARIPIYSAADLEVR